ncbi:YegS/Rv2252/BmrU family lipid kinase [Streptosporangium becharense]|uniref:YegS/Rv2252/BmrU family lipid kinase n=1 Tax=Streptosporangium becharense TaxID=1816182 RepID=A0A7W9IMI9_9ACTN|nr:diacylglycerol kinase family protein [Streptosporangium becharense]MBB2914483.1 YegS/Rv2252/BmrU family lipid kinase [Streptosporangium becharense]MBB5823485.1 YegS/Rv2252/BmrU family lipid kinase [Streptosporangium becharense]
MTELLAIYNEGAGSAGDRARAAAVDTLRAGGADVVEAPVGEKDLDETLDAHPGHDVVVLGGDGTLHVTVAALHRRGELTTRTVGLVPLGTGNDFARGLGIPLDPPQAARVVLAGRSTPLDLLLDDEGEVVVNVVHLGVGAEASERATPLKPALGRLAYPVGALLAGVRSPGWRLRVTVDGRPITDGRRVLMAGIGNGVTIGGGTPVAPRARPDDGMVDVVVALTTGPLQRLSYALRLRRGTHPGLRDVVTARGREVLAEGEPVPVNADGELTGRTSRRRWTVVPAAWRMFT